MARISLSKRSSISAKENENSQRSAERLEAAADENDYLEKSVNDSNQDEESNFDEEQNTEATPTTDQVGGDGNRLKCSDNKTDNEASNTSEDVSEGKETNPLKRKEPVDDEKSPKRQCHDV